MAEQVDDNQKYTEYRLPKTFKPVHYDLTLRPDLKKFTFDGEVKIDYTNGNEADNIVLNASELVISDGSCDDAKLKKVTYSKDTETATLEFENGPPPSGTINLKFTGVLNDKMHGFYRTSFKVGDNEVFAATTQFESVDARKCFPCWDEPAVKATFSVTLIYEQTMEAGDQKLPIVGISNMPVESQKQCESDLSKVEVRFEKSPIMSTYLLAFVVGPFEYIEGTDGRRPIRVYTTPGKTEQAKFALEVACKSLIYYEDYFNVKYPLPKMDMIAIPDFSAGAMENWGLVTYRETCLLVDPGNTATSRKQWVALVVAHEFAHQWFGNLVTMEWWTHLWLNEGFATFMEFLCVDHIFPEYDIWSQFVTSSYATAMSLDSLHNSHPIEVPVKKPSEIDEIFDDISYNKGSSVIRTLYTYIGDDSFRRGMNDYLTKFAYKNAYTEDLWDALEAASNKPIRKLMSGWTSQKGYPWLAVEYARDGDKANLTLTQSKFTADGQLPDDEKETKWMIPLSAVTSAAPTHPIDLNVLDKKSSRVTVDGVADGWVKLNSGTIGLYRVAYPEELMQKLEPAIVNQSLLAMDRLGLLGDLFALCQAGKVGSVDLLKLMSAFRQETDYNVGKTLDSSVGRLNSLLANTDFLDKFQVYGCSLFKNIVEKMGWTPKKDEKDQDAMLRAMVINRMVALGEPTVVEEAKRRYKAHLAKTEIIPADLRSAVYRAVSSYGDDADFDSLFALYRSSELSEEKNRAATAIGFGLTPEKIQRAIEFLLSDEVRNQDKFFVFMPIGATNPPAAFKFIKEHKDFLLEKYERGYMMGRFMSSAIDNFASEEKLQELTKYFEENKFPSGERAIQQSLERVRLNTSWLARDAEAMRSYLSM